MKKITAKTTKAKSAELDKILRNVNDNSSRRLLYIPPELDEYFVEKCRIEGEKKVNTMFKEALLQYVERCEFGSEAIELSTSEINSMIQRGVADYISMHRVKIAKAIMNVNLEDV